MIRSKNRLRLCITLLSLNLIFIWGNSLLPGQISGALSDFAKDILNTLLELLFGAQSHKPSGSGGLLRKLAHFTEFACLGCCLSWLFGMLRKKRFEQLSFPLLAGIAVAAVDETIQLFIPLRGPSLKDVGIDTLGVSLGIVIISLIHKLKNKKLNLEEYKL